MTQHDKTLATIIQNLPVEIANNLGSLILLMKTLGVIFIIYIIFLIIKGFLTIKTASRIRTIHKKVMIMDEKLDKLLKAKHITIKEKQTENKEKLEEKDSKKEEPKKYKKETKK